MIETAVECLRRVVLLDLENCPSIKGNNHVETILATAERVIAFHARGEPRVPLSLVRSLAAGLAAGRVEIEEVPSPVHMLADLGLLFWGGRPLGETPHDVEIIVVSLRNYIRSYLRDERRNASAIVAELVDGGHVAIDKRENVTYPTFTSDGNGAASGCSEHDEDCIPF